MTVKHPLKYVFIIGSIFVVGVFWLTFMAPGINDLPGNFKEIDAWQNENNTGPVNRVYIVTVSDTLWSSMEAYGNYMPHVKLGTTDVYYFLEGEPFPNQIIPGDIPFSPIYQKACVARYVKNHMNVTRLLKRPFQ